ncbi:helix-turn-helix domain-containing protein [Natrinema amylolyticum]|uniref:helix-turn-helix domain-containing protein n=1 Tax=Natrinema amylolyticum TaxID=2878679 RepID=UPI001CFAF32B|nr:helix-turn-helix domain-containing protein [Natrinema amylolyticum]
MGGSDSNSTDIFEIVSNSTRLEILRALTNAYSESPVDPWLDYTALRESVGIRDNGNFNYHLDRLEGLVAKDPDGYVITRVGLTVITAIASGSLDPDLTWGPVDVPAACAYCDEPLHLRYADGTLHLECGTPAHTLRLPASPRLLDAHPTESVGERLTLLVQQRVAQVRRGICPECQGAVDGEIRYGIADLEHYYYHGECRHCDYQHGFDVGPLVLPHPDVIAFVSEHGRDIRSTPIWELDFCTPGDETTVSTDPLQLRVDIERGDETLSVTLDRDGSVIATDRSRTA